MARLVLWMKREAKELCPAVAFFFLALNLIRATECLVLEDYGNQYINFADTLILALVAGKVILTVDVLKFGNLAAGKPLIVATLWKTLLASLFAGMFRFGERLVRLVASHGGLAPALGQLGETHWPPFWAIQIWITALLLIAVTFREFATASGMPHVGRMFFATPPRKTETE